MRHATVGRNRSRVTLAAAQPTTTRPSSSQYQAGLVSSGAVAPSASTVAITPAGSAGSRVAVPAAATTTIAPTPAQNQPMPLNSGYSAIDASRTAAAVVSVSRWFIRLPPACH